MASTFPLASNTFWTAGKWLFVLITLLLLLIVPYLIIHNDLKYGGEYVQLTEKQVQRVSSLILLNASNNADSNTTPLNAQQISLIVDFLNVELSGDIDAAQLAEIKNYLLKVDKREATAFLTDTRYKVSSYFFLTGSATYIEVIFWALFGVIASLLFYVADAYRKNQISAADGFDPTELPYQIAKLFYAPLTVLVLVLGYGLFSGQELIDIDAGKGMIIFAFVGGFYSGRMMNFLDRLKDVLIPGDETANQKPGTSAATGSSNNSTVAEVQVKLSLDGNLLTDAQKATIAEAGWNKGLVTLQPDAGEAIVLSVPQDDQDDTFTGTGIPFGHYLLKAAFSVADEDRSIINLEGSADVEISQSPAKIDVQMKKSDAAG